MTISMHRKQEYLRNKEIDHCFLFFEELFKQYYSSLLVYANKFINNSYAAEDIVQDVFMSLWIRRDAIDFEEPIKAYLYKATYHKSITYLNHLQNDINIDEQSIRYKLEQKILSFDHQDSLLLKELSTEINLFVDTLPVQCRKVFLLSRGKGLKNKEIAGLLGISEKTVEGHISKALFGLRSHLKKMDLMPITLIYLQAHIW